MNGDEGEGGEVRRLTIDKAHYKNCKLPPNFYVKKYFVSTGEILALEPFTLLIPYIEDAILYIAALHEEYLANDDIPEEILSNNNHLSAKTCAIGHSESTSYVITNENAKRCGLATVLHYLCYLDQEQEPSIMGTGVGYDFVQEMSKAANIVARLAIRKMKEYVNRKCARVIKTITVADPSVAGRGYVHAAMDAGYHLLVTFNKNNPYEAIKEKDIKTLAQEFVDNPVRKKGSEILDPVLDRFVEDRGNHWFFCKIDVCIDVP